MLMLTRRPGETVLIGSDIDVKVVEIRDNMVRLGITAPRSVNVDRYEIWLSKRADVDTRAKTAQDNTSHAGD